MPKLTLSQKDLKLAALLREMEILNNIQDHKIPAEVGTVTICCSDGDQFDDLYTHQRNVCHTNRHHQVTLAGGALVIPQKSPLGRIARISRPVVFLNVEIGIEKKGIKTIPLYGHAPCQAAYDLGLDLLDVIEQLICAKQELRKRFGKVQGFKVCPFLHIDYGDGKKRTYFVDKEKWLALGDKKAQLKAL
jgi:hypothetical protein